MAITFLADRTDFIPQQLCEVYYLDCSLIARVYLWIYSSRNDLETLLDCAERATHVKWSNVYAVVCDEQRQNP